MSHNGTRSKYPVFWELANDKVALVGSKNAALGRMFNQLKTQGISVPDDLLNGRATMLQAKQGHTLPALAVQKVMDGEPVPA